MATTLTQLITLAQQESDNVGQTFVSSTEWTSYINASYQELYGLIVQCFGNDYFTQSPATGYTFTTDGINQYFALPTDFFKLLGADLQVPLPSQWVSLKPFMFTERNKFNTINGAIPMAGQTVRLLYVPKPTLLVSGSDTVDGVNGWEEYIVIDAALKAMGKEESDVSVLAMRKQAMEARINSEAQNRDAGSPAVMPDVYGMRSRSMRYRLNGNNLWLVGNGTPGWGPWGDWSNDPYSGWW